MSSDQEEDTNAHGSPSVNEDTSNTNTETLTLADLYQQVLPNVPDPKDHALARELIQGILQDGETIRAYTENALKDRQSEIDHLVEERQKVYNLMTADQTNHGDNKTGLDYLRKLKHISHQVAQLRIYEVHDEDTIDCHRQRLSMNVDMLTCLLENENKLLLPWRLRFAADANPLRNSPMNIDLGFGGITSRHGKPVGVDVCDTCEWQIRAAESGGAGNNKFPRWRCMICGHVQCDDCHQIQQRHPIFGHEHPSNSGKYLGMVREYRHPVVQRVETAEATTLTDKLLSILQGWGDRPLFGTMNGTTTITWLTYAQVLDQVLRIVAKLKSIKDIQQVALCFPPGSMDYYICDLACMLAAIPTIGIEHPPQDNITDILQEVNAKHLFCENNTYHKLIEQIDKDNQQLEWIPHRDAIQHWAPYSVDQIIEDNNKQQDPDDALCTTYFTSGTTGTPKAIPTSRAAEVLACFYSSYNSDVPQCTISYLPPWWATDRNLVYYSMLGGARIGFSAPSPTMPQLIEAMQTFQPTMMVMPPAVVQFFCSLPDTPSLGGRLEHVAVGGGPVSSTAMQQLSDKYGIPNVEESYGTTETGGIASNGKIFDHIVDQVWLRDPNADVNDTGDNVWLDHKTQEKVVGELWIGDHNTRDIVELSDKGKKVRVLGRSQNAASFKLPNSKWCALVDIEDEIARTCRPDLFDEVMVWCNQSGVLVLMASINAAKDAILGEATDVLSKVYGRANLTPETCPQVLLTTSEPFPMTRTFKIQRNPIIGRFKEEANSMSPVPIESICCSKRTNGCLNSAADVAERVLGRPVDPTKSFIDNGGDSILLMQWIKELKRVFGDDFVNDWRSLMDKSLSSLDQSDDTKPEAKDGTDGPDGVVTIPTPPPVDPSAKHILLTGATGFLGRQVLKELLETDKDTVIVCLVRESSRTKLQASDRVLVVTIIPVDLKYRQIIHLAANVDHLKGYKALKADNVDLTEHILRLRLAPMLYCSTSGTKEGKPPYKDGYTQTKYESEQLVLRSGGSCFWPPLLLWGNQRDWLMRVIQRCIQAGEYPASALGFVVVCPVEVAAKDLISGRECSQWDLDLSELFLLLRSEGNLEPVTWNCFIANIQKDATSPAYPYLPLLKEKGALGNPRTASLDLLEIDWEKVWPVIQSCRASTVDN